MAAQRTSTQDIQQLASSLRTKLETVSQQADDQVAASMHEELSLLVEAVEESAGEDLTEERQGSILSSSLSAEALSPFLDAIDASLAGWQASIATAYNESATKELNDSLRFVEQMSAALTARETWLEQHQTKLQEQTSDFYKREARLARQRKTVARSLRTLKAESALEIERQRDQLRQEVEQSVTDAVRNEIRCELETRLREELGGQFRDELRQELTDGLREELQPEIREQLRAELSDQLHQSVLETLEVQIREELSLSLRDELTDILREELRVELSPALEEAARRAAAAQISDLELRLSDSQAELELTQQELEHGKAVVGSSHEQVDELKEQLAAAEANLLELQASAGEQKSSLEASQAALKATLQDAEARRAAEHSEGEQALLEMEEQLAAAREEADRLQTALEEATSKNASLEQSVKITQQAQSLDDESANAKLAELSAQLEAISDQLADSVLDSEDLRQQNSDLAAQLAAVQVAKSSAMPHINFDQQSLSWEERKKLMLQQLESESDDDSSEQHVKRLEVERVLSTTQQEIDRRDREIAELRAIVEQQSDTKQGVAIGAAAFAQMFDSDEMVQEERQKLRDIQHQWEEKLRQAEIDLSMERAKLARERLQLEAELDKIRSTDGQPEVDKNLPKKRKWLEHLGLKDENKK